MLYNAMCLMMIIQAGVMAALVVPETTIQPNVTFEYIQTKECASLPETSTVDHSRAVCPWTSTIDDNILRIPQRIIVMDETQGLPSRCNVNMTGNYSCEAIRRRMHVLWKINCNEGECDLEERTITVPVGLTCVQKGYDVQDGNERDKKCHPGKKECKKRTNGCKGKRRRQSSCRKICKKPNQKSSRCLNCKQRRKKTL